MKILKQELSKHLTEDELASLESSKSFYPFDKISLVILELVANKKIPSNELARIIKCYKQRNRYLYVYELSGAKFGSSFVTNLIQKSNERLVKPSKNIDKRFNKNAYDLALKYGKNIIRVELKSSRVARNDSSLPLVQRALKYSSNESFLMNFQQLKPYLCDVFIWTAVWTDRIVFWVFNKEELKQLRGKNGRTLFCETQHAGKKPKGKEEGQLRITDNSIVSLLPYRASKEALEKAVVASYKRLKIKED